MGSEPSSIIPTPHLKRSPFIKHQKQSKVTKPTSQTSVESIMPNRSFWPGKWREMAADRQPVHI
jgi:hypothetical protein